MNTATGRILLHVGRDVRRVVEADDIYVVEATGETTVVRLRSKRLVEDGRSLREMERVLETLGILRVHRNHAVNLAHVAAIRRRDAEADWEVVLEAPVNRVLPVSRTRIKKLWAAFGER